MTTTLRETALEQAWHQLPVADVVQRLESDPDSGLVSAEVKRRRQEFGPNELPLHRGKSPWLRFLEQFNQPLLYSNPPWDLNGVQG